MRGCPNCGNIQNKVKYVAEQFKVLKCRKCSLFFLGNPPDENLLYEDYYESSDYQAEAYRNDSNVSALAELYEINTQRIAVIKHLKPAGRLLDVGCGRGYFLATAREHGFEVTGIDISERALEYAKRSFGVDVTAKTLDELQETTAKFDTITLWHVLEHFIDPFDTLKKIRTLLQENGICVIEVPNLRSLKFMLSKNKWHGGNHPRYHRTFFTSGTLERALLSSGFSQTRRLKLSYHVVDRSGAYEAFKKNLNVLALDAFLDYVAWK